MTTDPMVSDLTARDFFAAAALEGMLCNGFQPIQWYRGPYSKERPYPWEETAYKIADAMLVERAKFYAKEKA